MANPLNTLLYGDSAAPAAARAPAAKLDGPALKKEAGKWLDRVQNAGKGQTGEWIKEAANATIAYLGQQDTEMGASDGKLYDYNILHSNVETIVPAVINSSPIPDIRQRFGDDDPVGRNVADLLERAIQVQVDNSALDVELEATAQDGFLAGRGIIRMRFFSDDETTSEPDADDLVEMADEEETDAQDVAENGPEADDATETEAPDFAPGLQTVHPADLNMGTALSTPQSSDPSAAMGLGALMQPGGQAMQPLAPTRSRNERIEFEAVSWRDFRHGAAKRWKDVPWVAFRHSMDPDDGGDFADKSLVQAQADDSQKGVEKADTDVTIWEVWVKRTRMVLFINEDTREIIKRVKDPLGLSRFFPMADPMQPIQVNGRLVPVCPFTIYRKLADEMDLLTQRIRKLTQGLKARGLVVGRMSEIQKLAELDDNELAAVEDIEQMATGGLENMIAWWPIDKIANVIRELITQRETIKAAIYEITGISDIVRGASNASETLGAQQIKTQWGSLRIQKMQRQIERAARDLFDMMSEAIPRLFSNATLSAITGIEVTPEMRQLLDDPIRMRYRVDVESNSTIRADVTARKGEMSEFLTGSAAYFQAVGPLVQQGELPPDVAIGIYTATARLFKLGKSVEDLLDSMVKQAKAKAAPQMGPDGQPLPPPQGAPDPAQLQAQAEQQLAQQEAEASQKEAEAKLAAIVQKGKDDAQLAAIIRAQELTKLAMMRREAQLTGTALPDIGHLLDAEAPAEQQLDPMGEQGPDPTLDMQQPPPMMAAHSMPPQPGGMPPAGAIPQ